MRRILTTVAGLVLGGLVLTAVAAAQSDAPKKYEDFDKVTQGAKDYEGLFRLYLKDNHLFAEIRPDQFNRNYLCPISVSRGLGEGGHMRNFDEQWILAFRRVGDNVQLIRRNVRYQARRGSPIARAVETTYTDSILASVRIRSIHPIRQGVLIDLNDLFMTDFAQLGLGFFDASRSTWAKVKTFPRNVELFLEATYGGGGRFRGGPVIDGRGTTVVLHYGLVELPDSSFQPRYADDRVGHFLSAVKDFTTDNRDTTFLRYVNRWRLERADGKNEFKPGDKLSAPKKKIIFWIENSVPDEYRAAVREGILEWNKAFEKIGFRDAIEVRQQEGEDFEPEDVNYNTFRWIANDRAYAMGPSRANPFTGELLDADIVFDASMVRSWKQQYALSSDQSVSKDGSRDAEEPISLIRAARQGWGLSDPLDELRKANGMPGWDDRGDRRRWAVEQGVCQCGPCMSHELGLATMAFETRGLLKPGEKVPEELIQQAIKEVTMHEVGHTLGLRHNFKASTMLKNEELHDTKITREKGLVGSVMDYAPINLAAKGQKQGDYFSTTLGPYDYLAIEYAYRPLPGGTEGEYEKLQEIAARGAQAGHDYATDEDLYFTSDPFVNQWDLGSDPMKFAQTRIQVAEEMLKGLEDRVVEKGEGYQRLRSAFGMLIGQYGNGAYLIVAHVGGEHMHRDHRGDPNGRDPFVPVKAAKQREALKFLQDHLLTDKPFQFSPTLLRRLGADRWSHWDNPSATRTVDYPVHERILSVQRVVLDHLFDPTVLRRMQNTALKVDKDEQPLTISEAFRSLTDGIWVDVPKEAPKDGKRASSSIVRRNLQREHLKELTGLIVDGRAAPADARSLARMHLREIGKRIETTLADKQATLDDATRAHLEESQERIAKVLTASIQFQP